ncbi:hypothetical protein [Streptomyces chiangmaiensis]|uniref:Oxidoreductase n=1 Tax=Streptomyces chiangmaiensis TaxID=766497 RepID=A0ABU7FL44_9ACTN|nr:hypothetical protein [Streptomyces chiangmaiensis]MED7824817.1 hypothetical protein [Streptomyces chiangmaiensis]
MAFARWLRTNSEHYLLVAAQQQVAEQYGARRPRPPEGLKDFFWLRVFAPIYRLLPWVFRAWVLKLMPGSHRKQWPAARRPAGPAV